MKSLTILGCGCNAYDAVDIVDAINAVCPTWKIVGILDDACDRDNRLLEHAIFGGVADAPRFSDSRMINSIGSDRSFQSTAEIIAATGLPQEQFATLVHPAAHVSPRAKLGCRVCACGGATIVVGGGDHVSIVANAVIAHDSTLGNHTVVAPAAVVSGFVRVGESCYPGAAAAIKQELSIGADALVGMAANVTCHIAASDMVVGNPARQVTRQLDR